LPILSLSSSIHFLIFDSFHSISFFSSQIISKVLFPLAHSPFYYLQFFFNLSQYFLLYCLFDYPNNFFTINCPGSFSLLNVLFSLFCYLTSFMSYQYFFSNSSTTPFAFSKFSILSQVSDSTVNSFYHTRYLSFSLIHYYYETASKKETLSHTSINSKDFIGFYKGLKL